MGVKQTYKVIKPHKWWHWPMVEVYHTDYARVKDPDDKVTRITKITYCCKVHNCEFEAIETHMEAE